jgi:hypothetical protein
MNRSGIASEKETGPSAKELEAALNKTVAEIITLRTQLRDARDEPETRREGDEDRARHALGEDL